MYAGFQTGNLMRRDHLEDIGIHMMMILKWMLNK